MRMWMVDTKIMCRKHLLGEHVEIHMLVGTLNQGKSIKGYLDKGLVEPFAIWSRHRELSREMLKRGYRHKSLLPIFDCFPKPLRPVVDVEKSLEELLRRCPECEDRYYKNCLGLKNNT